MDKMLARLDFAVEYIDDILLKSENIEQPKEHITAVFQKIDEYGFKLCPENCIF